MENNESALLTDDSEPALVEWLDDGQQVYPFFDNEHSSSSKCLYTSHYRYAVNIPHRRNNNFSLMVNNLFYQRISSYIVTNFSIYSIFGRFLSEVITNLYIS